MVRVAGLKRRLSAGLPVRGGDRLPLRTQLELIAERTADLVARHAACFVDDVLPKLADEDIRILRWSELDDAERERLRTSFREQIFPVLTPLAVDPAHPFPYISGRSLNLAVAVRDPRRRVGAVRPGQGAQQRAPLRPRWTARPAGRPAVPAGGGPDRGAPRAALLRHAGGRVPPVPGHPQRRGGGRRGPRRGPAPGPGAGAGPAPVRPAGAPGGRRLDLRPRAGAAGPRAGHGRPATCCGCPACSTCPRCGRSTARPTGRT